MTTLLENTDGIVAFLHWKNIDRGMCQGEITPTFSCFQPTPSNFKMAVTSKKSPSQCNSIIVLRRVLQTFKSQAQGNPDSDQAFENHTNTCPT